MLAKSILLIASAALTLASPVAQRDQDTEGCPSSSHPVPTLPQTGGSEELPPPPSGLKLKYIALGLGIQNYTCSSINASSSAASSTGALAMFYDITHLYPGRSSHSLPPQAFDNLTALALNTHPIPLNFNSSSAGRVDPSSPGASLTNPFPADTPPLQLAGCPPLPCLGRHFFNAAGSPTFVLHNGAVDVVATKNASASAPPSADPGPDRTGAVAWLALSANPGSRGAKFVYRVLTAGGNSHGCTAVGEDSTGYSAQYWFYD